MRAQAAPQILFYNIYILQLLHLHFYIFLFLKFGDKVKIELLAEDGANICGSIEQVVCKYV